MNLTWNLALSQALAGVLESLCFMVPTPKSMLPPGSDAAPLDHAHKVRVRFTGPFDGVLELALPPTLLDAITSSMLGEDGPHPEETLDQAVCELANITCGNVLPLIAGERAIFDLGSPEVLRQVSPIDDADAAISLRMDEGVIESRLKLSAGSWTP